jgi:MFS family permease
VTSAAATPRIDALADSPETQRWAYGLVLTLTGIALGVSGMPAPLYGIYQAEWHLTPLMTTVVFAVYALAALVAVLVSGTISDSVGRKPVLIAATATLVVGLVIFLFASNVWMLLAARTLHGAAVGSIVVSGAAALMDLRPDHGRRTGQLSGAAFNIGITFAILTSSLLAQYSPYPLRLPFLVIGTLVLAVGVGLLALTETHTDRTTGPVRIAKPSVPAEIRVDFWFAALGVMASWSVLGVLLSLFPTLAAMKTGVHNLVFGGAVVAVAAFAAALAQLFSTDIEARRAALIGDVAMAAALLLTIPALISHNPYAVFTMSAVLGGAFGLSFGGSLRHLSNVVPADRRGETMSAYYLLAYSAMAFPTIAAGAAATEWGLAAIYPWFAAAAAVACVAAAVLGLRNTSPA